jgi:hypothetical protein
MINSWLLWINMIHIYIHIYIYEPWIISIGAIAGPGTRSLRRQAMTQESSRGFPKMGDLHKIMGSNTKSRKIVYKFGWFGSVYFHGLGNLHSWLIFGQNYGIRLQLIDAHMWDISWNINKLQVGCFKHVHIFYPPNATILHSRHICWVFPLVAGDSVEPSKRLSISGVGGRHIGIAFGTGRCDGRWPRVCSSSSPWPSSTNMVNTRQYNCKV